MFFVYSTMSVVYNVCGLGLSKETKELLFKQYMVLAKVKGDASEILKFVDASLANLDEAFENNEVIADRIFDLLLSFSNDMGEIIKEYLASKPEIT